MNHTVFEPREPHERAPLRIMNGFYNEAKRLEYAERNLPKAIEYYRLAIRHGQKVDSAIKDLAAVLHQSGSTREAVDFLMKHRDIYRGDLEKYDNLIQNLSKQITAPSGKNLIRYLLLLNVPTDPLAVKDLFSNSSRIQAVQFFTDLSFKHQYDSLSNHSQSSSICLISFHSYSAAKKTFDSLKLKELKPIEAYWVNVNKLVACEATFDQALQLNVYYQGFVWFGCTVTIEDERDLVSVEALKKCQAIWNDEPKYEIKESPIKISILHLENQAKIQMIKSRRGTSRV